MQEQDYDRRHWSHEDFQYLAESNAYQAMQSLLRGLSPPGCVVIGKPHRMLRVPTEGLQLSHKEAVQMLGDQFTGHLNQRLTEIEWPTESEQFPHAARSWAVEMAKAFGDDHEDEEIIEDWVHLYNLRDEFEPPAMRDLPEHCGIPRAVMDNLPGVMRSIVDFVTRTNPRRQPVYGLAAALALMSVALGRKVVIEGFGTWPHLYLIGVGRSGSGKNRPLTAIKQILIAAGLADKWLGLEDITCSDAGILSSLKEQPVQIMLVDEIGRNLAAINVKGQAAHVSGILTTLLKLYSAGGTIYKGKAYADSSKNVIIVAPAVSLIGMTVPKYFFDAIGSADIEGGILSRAMALEIGEYFPPITAPEPVPVPEDVIAWLRGWDTAPTNANPMERQNGEPVIRPTEIPLSPAAQKLIQDFTESNDRKMTRAEKLGIDAVYVRAVENALKLALIHACAWSCDPTKIEIGEDSVRWSITLSNFLTERMAKLVSENVAETPFAKNVAKIRAAITKAGIRGLTAAEIAKRFTMPATERNQILQHLRDARDIDLLDVNADRVKSDGGRVKPREAYVATSLAGGIEDDDG